MPLQLDGDESIAGKERRADLDPAAVGHAPLTQARKVNLVAVEFEAMHRQALAMRLKPRTRPVRHRLPHHAKAVAIAGAGQSTHARVRVAEGTLSFF